MQKRRKSIILLVVLIVSLFFASAFPAYAACSFVSNNGKETPFEDMSLSWCYTVYQAKATGKQTTFKLNQNFTAYTKESSIEFNGQKYKYKKYDLGVNVRECDLGVGLTSGNTISAFRNGALWIPPGTNIVIDLNGYCIDRKVSGQRDDGEVINIESGGTLTLIDSNPRSGNGAFNGGAIMGGASEDGAGGIHIKGTLNFKAGTIYNCNTDEHGGALFVSGSGTLNMTGGQILSCQTKDSKDDCNGGGIYVDGGKCNLSNCKIENCDSEDNGGALYMRRGTLNCSGVSFVNNRSKDEGGALYFYEGNSTMRKCTISDNRAKDGDRGGAIMINTASKFKHVFEDCSILRNSGGEGGAMYVDDGNLEVKNCLFKDNYSNDDGGVLFKNSSHPASFVNTTFENNSCKHEGGVMFLNNGKTDIKNCRFNGNHSKDDGGAIFADTADGIYLIDNTFERNTSDNTGGAIHINDDKVVLSGAIMTGNEAKDHGGAIYVDADHDLNIQGYCRILDNKSHSRHTQNIALQTTGSKHAYLYAGSIEEGSCIHIASTKSGEQPITKKSNISQYQYSHYFVTDSSTPILKNIEKRNTVFVSSVFSNGSNLTVIIIGIVIMAGAAVYCLFLAKKRRATSDD